jgi:hypothetical protein
MSAGAAAIRAAVDGGESELDQVLALHAAEGAPRPAELPLGEGDRRLLALHDRLTGRAVEVTATCPACGTECLAALAAESAPPPAPRCLRLGRGGGLRQPTYGDIRDLAEFGAAATEELLRRCTVGSPGRRPQAAELAGLDDSLAGPLLLRCAEPECGAEIETDLDVQTLVLQSLQRHCEEVDVEVHLLAGSYGWGLREIEELPEARRRRLARIAGEAR